MHMHTCVNCTPKHWRCITKHPVLYLHSSQKSLCDGKRISVFKQVHWTEGATGVSRDWFEHLQHKDTQDKQLEPCTTQWPHPWVPLTHSTHEGCIILLAVSAHIHTHTQSVQRTSYRISDVGSCTQSIQTLHMYHHTYRPFATFWKQAVHTCTVLTNADPCTPTTFTPRMFLCCLLARNKATLRVACDKHSMWEYCERRCMCTINTHSPYTLLTHPTHAHTQNCTLISHTQTVQHATAYNSQPFGRPWGS